jgi:hypothetical protein
MATQVITFKPKQVTKNLIAGLPKRAQDVIVKRYGLGNDSEKMTLEAIGRIYGITRERVRQIENFALKAIRSSDAFKAEAPVFEELRALMIALGGLVAEHDYLHAISDDRATQNHIHFFLVLGDMFVKHKEDEHFVHRWSVDSETREAVERSLKTLYESLSDEDLIEESQMIDRFLRHLKDVNANYRNHEIARRWLKLSRRISRNPLGEWGVAHSPNVSARGIRDFAYLVLRKNGSPMHFTEVAKSISQYFEKKAHVATTHNELIKDKRFVLVGRGLYALAEWGYSTGVVRDVINDILAKHGPLTKDEIIEKVLRERYVKPNTIIVNLQNTAYFKKTPEGKFINVK